MHTASEGQLSALQPNLVQYPAGSVTSQVRSPCCEQSLALEQESPISGWHAQRTEAASRDRLRWTQPREERRCTAAVLTGASRELQCYGRAAPAEWRSFFETP